jgi:hypothetical protein
VQIVMDALEQELDLDLIDEAIADQGREKVRMQRALSRLPK